MNIDPRSFKFRIIGEIGDSCRATRFCSIPCKTCNEDTTHYVGKCIHCKTVNVRMPGHTPQKLLFRKSVT